MGKASFATLRDASGDIQIYVTKNNVDDSVYEDFKTWDLGDIAVSYTHLTLPTNREV